MARRETNAIILSDYVPSKMTTGEVVETLEWDIGQKIDKYCANLAESGETTIVIIVSCWIPSRINISAIRRLTPQLDIMHGRPHIGANGASWPPGIMGEKLKKRKRAKSSFLCLCYILRAIRAGSCRERRYADHKFIYTSECTIS